MASLKEIKTRISSVRNTMKMTSAMKMVASAKLHKAQAAIGGKLPYELKLHRILAGMLQDDDLRKALHSELGFGGHGHHSHPMVLQDVSHDALPSKSEVRRVAIVAFSSNSSLCGVFNANVSKLFLKTVAELESRGYSYDDIDVYAVGRKVAETAKKAGFDLKADLQGAADRPSYDAAEDLASDLVDSFSAGEVSHILLIYNHLASTSSQPSVRENYLPLALHEYDEGAEAADYILEPDPITLVKALLPKVLVLKIYTVMLDANAAEHAARTVAMQVASDNAKELIDELTLAYNKGRQQEITAELLDIAGGTIS